MTTLYDFLREQPLGGNALDELDIQLHVLRQVIDPRWMSDIRSDADRILCEFTDLAALERFLGVIAERALDCPTMIPYLTEGIDWKVTVGLEISETHRGADGSPTLVKPILQLDRASFVAVALTAAYDNWIDRDDDQSVLSAIG